MKRSIITSISLLFFAVASFAEVSGERPISEPAYGPAPGTQSGSGVASDGHDFLVAWIDSYRTASPFRRIYAARMNAAGEVLDLLNIRLPTTTPQLYRLDVVFLGNSYLVYWDEPSRVSPGENALVGARISRDGVLIDATARILADRATVNIRGAASNGNRTVIAYVTSGESRILVLDRDGNVVGGPKAFTSAGAPAASGSSMVASNGRDFLVMSIRGAVLYPARLDSYGDVTSKSAVSTTPATSLLDLASDGDAYVAIFQEPTGVESQHISAAAQMLDTWKVPVAQIIPGFAFAGNSYLLMDANPAEQTVGVRRLDRTGQPTGSYVVVSNVAALSGGASLASNGADAALFWADWSSPASFLGALVNGQSLAALKTSPIARSANEQAALDTATNGRNMAIVWNENDGLYAGRISLDGQILDGRGVRVGARSVSDPRIVYDGTNYVIAWTDFIRTSTTNVITVKLSRFSPESGAILDPSGIAISSSNCVFSVTLAAGAASTLLAWSDCQHLMATTFGRDGSIATAATVTTMEADTIRSVSAAWNGREWLVAWEDDLPPGPADPPISYDVRIWAARLSPSLTVLDPSPIILANTLRDSMPLVASDGDGFLVVWTNYRSGDTSNGVMAQRISSDGSLLAQANGTRVAYGTPKSVVWNGTEFDVALVSSTLTGPLPNYSYNYTYTLYVTHIAAAGAIEGLLPLTVVTGDIDPHASLVVTGIGRTATVYTRVGSEPQYGDVERAFVSVPHAIRGRAVR